MARPEWLRTFLAVYRAGSVSEGARRRHLSQPAASQQLAALERSVGHALFARGPDGVTPTPRGRELYGDVAEPLDRLERVLEGLDAGHLRPAEPVVRVGAVPEYLASVVVPVMARQDVRVRVTFGPDAELLDQVAKGELDVALAPATSTRRPLAAIPVAAEPFVLVGAPGMLPPHQHGASPARLGAFLAGRPWVAYSFELPMTRRCWQTVLGRPFAATLRLVAADRRVVADAVRAGMGFSLLPRYVCAEALARGDMEELLPLGGRVPAEPWYATCRQADLARPEVADLVSALS